MTRGKRRLVVWLPLMAPGAWALAIRCYFPLRIFWSSFHVWWHLAIRKVLHEVIFHSLPSLWMIVSFSFVSEISFVVNSLLNSHSIVFKGIGVSNYDDDDHWILFLLWCPKERMKMFSRTDWFFLKDFDLGDMAIWALHWEKGGGVQSTVWF